MANLSTTSARSGATFSPDGVYRYSLWREWAPGPRVTFILLNPSTADAAQDDPTIRRCAGFARDLGFGSMEVVNLCALRSTDPRALLAHPDPVGPANATHLAATLRSADLAIAGWGNHGLGREGLLAAALGTARLRCLGRTRLAAPRHPLYLPRSTPLADYDEGPHPRAALPGSCPAGNQATAPADFSSAILAAS